MKLKEILSPSFSDFKKPRKPMITVSTDSDFCREVVARGWLTEEQMTHAAKRYCLGKSRSGKTIFWMIDERGICRDGHIGEAWVSQMLKAREPKLLQFWHAEHSLFGLHLLSEELRVKSEEFAAAIVVVEPERSAVIMSELYPQYLWLATVYPVNLTPEALKPLKGHHIILLPPSDPTGETCLLWLEIATHARRLYHLDISVHYSNFFQT